MDAGAGFGANQVGDAAGVLNASAGDAAASATAGVAEAATGAMDAGTGFGANQAGDAAGMLDVGAGEAAKQAADAAAQDAGSRLGSNAFSAGTGAMDAGQGFGAFKPGDAAGMLDSGPGILDRVDAFGKWVGKNKELVKIGSDVVGGIARAVPSDKEKAEIELLRQKAEEQKRRNTWWSGPRKGS
jgi:hypothetical protein